MTTKSLLTAVTALATTSALLCPALHAEDLYSEQPIQIIEEAAINNGKISFFGGIEATSAYYSRGQKYEDRGVILQPYVGMNINVFSDNTDSDVIKSLDVYGLWWNSIHSARTDTDTNPNSCSPESFYESDYIIGATFGLFENVTFNAEYWYETAPNNTWNEIQDLNLKLAYNDADFWDAAGIEIPGFTGLKPWAKVSLRLDCSGDEHNYFFFGINPSFDPLQSESIPVTFSTPVQIGIGDGDFYGKGGEDFGFIDSGIDASLPLDFINKEYGSWTATAGFHLQYIGDQARTNRTWMPIAKVGLHFSY